MQAIPCSKGHYHPSSALDPRLKAATEEGLWPRLPLNDLETGC